ERAMEALLAALKDKRDEVRAWAAEALGKEKGDEVVKALCAALKDKYGVTRRRAAQSLLDIGDTSASAALAERIADDVWEQLPKRGSITPWHEAPDARADLGSKERALKALQKLAPDKVAAALEKAKKSKSEDVRKWAEAKLKKS